MRASMVRPASAPQAQASQSAPLQPAPVSQARAGQSRLASMIDGSPRLVAQAQCRAVIFGAPVQQQKASSVNHLPHDPEEDETHQLKAAPAEAAAAQTASAPNRTGLPDNLKAGVESLSGMSLDHVKVHYNSAQPAQLNALAYAQGSEIHIAPGQEKHLPHEAWHVVQQAQGRVKPTRQMKSGVAVNDDAGLEREADVMGARAAEPVLMQNENVYSALVTDGSILQRKLTEDGSKRLMTQEEVDLLIQAHPDKTDEINHKYQLDEIYVVVTKTRSGLKINKLSALAPRSGGAMYGRVGGEASEDIGLQTLTAAASSSVMMDDTGEALGTEILGANAMGVKKVVAPRVARHQKPFKDATGDKSAKSHAVRILGEDAAEFDWDITHLKGYGQVGPGADVSNNLVAASKHANTEMMFFDNVITGRTDLTIKTRAEVFTGTRVAKTITMIFAYKAAPDTPFYKREVYSIRPAITKEEAAQLKGEAQKSITDFLNAVDAMLSMASSSSSSSSDAMDAMDAMDATDAANALSDLGYGL